MRGGAGAGRAKLHSLEGSTRRRSSEGPAAWKEGASSARASGAPGRASSWLVLRLLLRRPLPPRAFDDMELEELGVREECGVFGCIASGEWPTQLDVPHVITLGLVGLQHR